MLSVAVGVAGAEKGFFDTGTTATQRERERERERGILEKVCKKDWQEIPDHICLIRLGHSTLIK